MKHRIPITVLAGLGLLLLAWWLLRPADRGPEAPAQGLAPVSEAEPASITGPRSLASRPGVSPAVHLPQLQAGPDDIDPERRGPSNLPPGTPRTRLAASGKLAHYVIEEYAESFRECFEQHGASDPDLPTRVLLEFTISAEPIDTGDPVGTVTDVQVLTGGADYELSEHAAFEGCCAQAVTELELDPPGGRRGGQMRFGMTIDLDQGELVDEARGAGQAQ
jgi:hypothetical protein